MDYRILGPLEAEREDRPLAVTGRKPRALLALLLLHPNETVPTDRLIDDLWGERPPATAANTLQVYVSKLRKLLADRLVTEGAGYALRVEPDELDAARFERIAEQGRAALTQRSYGEAAERLHEALALWRGPALADLRYEPFAQAEITRLEELRLAAVEDRIEAELFLGRHDQLVAELEALVSENPLRERLRRQLMLSTPTALRAMYSWSSLGWSRAPSCASSSRRSSARTSRSPAGRCPLATCRFRRAPSSAAHASWGRSATG